MKYYCIGIKGTGMSSLAQILFDLGNEVSGYDDEKEEKFSEKGLKERNIKIYNESNHILEKDTIATYSMAFKEDHKERKRIEELGLTIKKYNEVLGDISKMFRTISVAGTHGKTTTSSIIKHLLSSTIGCNYFIGAGDGYARKENEVFVLEADEFNKHFLAYTQKYAVITNIEKEHMECYTDLEDIINTFSKFASNTKKEIIAYGDDENIRKLKTNTKTIYYGLNENNDYIIKNIETRNSGSKFDLYEGNKLINTFTIPLFSKAMILNATAAIIIALKHNITSSKIKELLLSFKNAARRFAEEHIGSNIIIDDYAHHPTEIKTTIEAVKEKYKEKRLVIVFVPNTYSRTRDFKNEFVEVLKLADKTYLTEIDSNRERQEEYPGVCSRVIVEKIPNAEIINVNTITKLKNEENAVICFLSCANTAHLIEAYKNLFK